MNVKLYGIPGSHPVMSARSMLEYKGIEYKRVDLFRRTPRHSSASSRTRSSGCPHGCS
jgi:arsenate reductase-like glutaredoxin family protein